MFRLPSIDPILLAVRVPSVTALLFLLTGIAAATPDGIVDVGLDAASFNPSGGQVVTLNYRLEQAAEVKVQVYDPDGGLVRTLIDGSEQPAGDQRMEWPR